MLFCCSCFVFILLFCWLLKPSMWWDPEKRFCVPCDCNPTGSVSPQCDMTGRCICKSGFIGKQCNLGRQVHRQEEQPWRAQRVRGSPRRWGSSSSSGCPRGAYGAPAPVIPEALHGVPRHVVFRVPQLKFPGGLLPNNSC